MSSGKHRFDVGDFVDVHCHESSSLFQMKILHSPSATGDGWVIYDTINKKRHMVMEYQRMDESTEPFSDVGGLDD